MLNKTTMTYSSNAGKVRFGSLIRLCSGQCFWVIRSTATTLTVVKYRAWLLPLAAFLDGVILGFILQRWLG